MCGIAGIAIRGEKEALERVDIHSTKKMLDAMGYRGPDACNIWYSSKHSVCLGHNRLSIIDTTSSGNQPMSSNCGRFKITFNGEIYNFKNLKEHLQQKGRKFRSESDTEVFVELFAEYGQECWKHIDGMFAVAIYDKSTKRLTISRDRYGEKPLYWKLTDNRVEFASELKCFLGKNNTINKVNPSELAKYFLYRYVPAPDSLIEGIRKLKPGHQIIVENDGRVTEQPWHKWEAQPTDRKLSQANFENVCNDVEEELLRSIERRLVADVPIGLFLSAGIDSTLVAAICARVFNKQLEAFSFGTNNNPQSEHNDAGIICQSLGHNFNTTCTEKIDFADEINNIGHSIDEPCADRGFISQLLVARLAKTKVTVCLSGDGADELFGGYDRYLKLQLKGTNFKSNYYNSFAYEYFDSALKVMKFADLEEAFPENMEAIIASVAKFYPYTLSSNLKNSVSVMRTIDMNSYLPDCVLTKVDRTTMRNSLESRTPYLTQRLGAICERLPDEYCIDRKTNKQKLILRYLASKYLNEKEKKIILSRKKQGFGITKEIFVDHREDIIRLLKQSREILQDRNIIKFEQSNVISQALRSNNSIWAYITLAQWVNHHNVEGRN